MVFVVVEQEGSYSDSDWKIVCVADTIERAEILAWISLVKKARKPWTIEFYTDRSGEFSNAIGVPEYHIEEWDPVRSTKTGIWFLGYNLDSLLKEKYENCDELLRAWLEMLESGIVPDVLHAMLVREIRSEVSEI